MSDKKSPIYKPIQTPTSRPVHTPQTTVVQTPKHNSITPKTTPSGGAGTDAKVQKAFAPILPKPKPQK